MARRRRSLIICGVTTALLGACSTDPFPSVETATTSPVRGSGGPGLVRAWSSFTGCDDLVGWVRAEMDARVSAWGLSEGWYGPMPIMERVAVEDMAGSAPDAGDGAISASLGSGDTSGTTVQEEGIDEGDLVETDGRYVYSVVDGVLRVADLDTATVLGRRDLVPGDHQLILTDTALIVVTQRSDGGFPSTRVARFSPADDGLEFLAATHLEGSTTAVRASGSTIRLVLRHDPTRRLDFVMPRSGGASAEELALTQNRDVIAGLTANELLPRSFEESPSGSRTSPSVVLGCDRVGVPAEFSGFGLTWIATFDTSEPADDLDVIASGGVMADASAIYMSSTSMYVATTRADDGMGPTVATRPEPLTTRIHRFDLGSGPVADYAGSGEVPGWLVNSYALSEFDGHLRVATTSDAAGFGGELDSGIHVLSIAAGPGDSQTLDETGSVRGLGIGETIQAVRFMGTLGYVVTFRQVDPLYVVDLADPGSPRVEGELKIPGFSTHLHPVGAGRLVGIGFAGTDDGRITGTQVSLFDVEDVQAPALLSTTDIGDWTEATSDPHALLWWPATGDVMVPAPEGALVVGVSPDALVLRGRLAETEPARRILIAQGRLVTVHSYGVAIWDLESLSKIALIDWN